MITPSNGYLDGMGSYPYGAHADHTHDYSGDFEPKNASLLKASKVTIAVADWEEASASVALPEGFAAYVSYVVDNGSDLVAKTAELVLSEVGEESLTFTVTDVPEEPIDVWILFL